MVKMTEEPEDFEGKWPDPRERSAPARREEMAAFAAELKADPAKAQKFFQEAGILNERGELTPQYGGPQEQAEPVTTVTVSDNTNGMQFYDVGPIADLPPGRHALYLHPPADETQHTPETENDHRRRLPH